MMLAMSRVSPRVAAPVRANARVTRATRHARAVVRASADDGDDSRREGDDARAPAVPSPSEGDDAVGARDESVDASAAPVVSGDDAVVDVHVGDGAATAVGDGATTVKDASALAPEGARTTSERATATASGGAPRKKSSSGKKKSKSKSKTYASTRGRGMAAPEPTIDVTLVAAGAAAVGVVGYFAWTKLKGGNGVAAGSSVTTSSGEMQASGAGGVGEEGMPVMNVTDDAGMDGPVNMDGPATKAKAPKRTITREAKRMLRDVMDELRRSPTVDASGKNLGDEGMGFISESCG